MPFCPILTGWRGSTFTAEFYITDNKETTWRRTGYSNSLRGVTPTIITASCTVHHGQSSWQLEIFYNINFQTIRFCLESVTGKCLKKKKKRLWTFFHLYTNRSNVRWSWVYIYNTCMYSWHYLTLSKLLADTESSWPATVCECNWLAEWIAVVDLDLSLLVVL